MTAQFDVEAEINATHGKVLKVTLSGVDSATLHKQHHWLSENLANSASIENDALVAYFRNGDDVRRFFNNALESIGFKKSHSIRCDITAAITELSQLQGAQR